MHLLAAELPKFDAKDVAKSLLCLCQRGRGGGGGGGGAQEPHSAKMVGLNQLWRRIAEVILERRGAPAGCRAAKADQLPGAGGGKPDKAGGVHGTVDDIVGVHELQGLRQAVHERHAVSVAGLLLRIQLPRQQILQQITSTRWMELLSASSGNCCSREKAHGFH